jgi:hypothetical protein
MNQKTANTYDDVLHMNVQGVLLMQESKFAEAVPFFQKGLETLSSNNLGIANAGECPTSESSFCEIIYSPQHRTRIQVDELEKGEKQGRLLSSVALLNDNAAVHDDIFLLFRRALHMPSAVEIGLTRNNEAYREILSGVIIYNVGLAHHLVGLQNGESQVISRALEFYLMAYSAFKGQIKFLRGKNHGLIIGLMAISNNAGHIYAHSRSFALATICHNQLSFCLSTTISLHINDHPSLSEEYKIFFLNVCFFQERSLVSAPAA